MDNQELDILIIRYLNEDMTTEEKAVFEKRMSNDEALKASVEEYKTISKGINVFAKNEMKADLILAQSAMLKSNTFKDYKPSINGGGFSFLGFTVKLILLSLVVTAGLFYFDKINYEHEYIDVVKDKMEEIEEQFKIEMRQDTIWKTVRSTKIQSSDTVFIHNQSELDSFYNEIEEADDLE